MLHAEVCPEVNLQSPLRLRLKILLAAQMYAEAYKNAFESVREIGSADQYQQN